MSLLEKCKEQKITLAELSDITEISVEYLSRLNTGKDKNPSLKVMDKICDVFEISLDELKNILKN